MLNEFVDQEISAFFAALPEYALILCGLISMLIIFAAMIYLEEPWKNEKLMSRVRSIRYVARQTYHHGFRRRKA